MQSDQIRELYTYNAWANRRFWDCVTPLSAVEFTRPIAGSTWSLHTHCMHIMAVESWWFRFLRTGEVRFLDRDEFTDRAMIRRYWDTVERSIQDYLATRTPNELTRTVKPDFWHADQTPVQVWQALLHILNHSTDHRAQAMAAIQAYGGHTVEQEYLEFLWEKAANGA